MSARWVFLTLGLVLITGSPVLAQNDKPAVVPAMSERKSDPAESRRVEEGSGEQKFQQNCSRCHHAPEGFSPRIAGTIVKHMRVRASLSEKDARDILRYLNPQ